MTRKKVYEGKAKILFEGPEPGTLIQYFKDDATAFNNQKKGVISGKGVLNNRISEYIMTKLEEIGIDTHFIKALNMREQLVRENESVYIVATQWHRLENPGKVPVEIIEVQIGSYLGEDDILRTDDIYNRAPEETK